MLSSKYLAVLLSSEFAKAEKAVKDYEHLTAELPVPSINELRYVGCHEQIQVMRNFINDFLAAQNSLYAAIAQEQKSSHRSWIQCIIGIAAGFGLGIVVTLIFS